MAKKSKNLSENTKEGVETMALAQRINPGFIISCGKEDAFFKKMNENRPTKEFWDECVRLRNNINQETINEINMLMGKEEE